MSKSRHEITKHLSDKFWKYSYKMGVFRCPEVTIYEERVDFLTYTNRDDCWRFYEVKSCKEDFYSSAKWTFLGQYNYFVMNDDLYKEVKDDIPKHVGVTNGYRALKRATKQELGVDEEYLMKCFIRSLSTQLNSERSKVIDLEYEVNVLREGDSNL